MVGKFVLLAGWGLLREEPPLLWPPFLCREQLAMPRCGFTAGTEVQGGLVGPGRLQGQGESLLLSSDSEGYSISVTPTPTPASVTDTI